MSKDNFEIVENEHSNGKSFAIIHHEDIEPCRVINKETGEISYKDSFMMNVGSIVYGEDYIELHLDKDKLKGFSEAGLMRSLFNYVEDYFVKGERL